MNAPLTPLPTFKRGDIVENYIGKHRYAGRVMDIDIGESGRFIYHIQTNGRVYREAPMIQTDGFGWRKKA